MDEWDIYGKRIFVLRQVGRFADVCFDHGLALASELEDGVFPEILATIAHDTDAGPALRTGLADRLQGVFYNQLCRDVLRACSDEFRRGVEALERGYRAGLPNPLFNRDAVEYACVAIDVGNIATVVDRGKRQRRVGIVVM